MDVESWTIKKAEHQRIDTFELWCWRWLLRVPGTARRSNQSILKEISTEYLLEGLILKLQYFGHLMWRTDSLEKTLILGKIEAGREGDDRGWDGWVASLTRWTWVWASSESWWWTGKPGELQSMKSQRTGYEQLNWTKQSLWRKVWRFLKKLKIELPYYSAFPLLGSYQKKKKQQNMVWKDTCNRIYIVALFTIAKTWKQLKYLSIEEWVKKIRYIYTKAYYSVIKKENEIMSFGATWMDL